MDPGPAVDVAPTVDTAFRLDALRATVYERILFPTDGSDAADVAMGHAVAFARRFEAPLHVFSVVDVRATRTTDAYAGQPLEATQQALDAASRVAVEEARERAERDDLTVTTDVVEGRPANAIVDAAREGDVIVMGTHGRTGLDRYLIGSTTEKVVRTADVPVVTVPVAEPTAAEE
jgi:nucleotide-binding universal stress UspA family protein